MPEMPAPRITILFPVPEPTGSSGVAAWAVPIPESPRASMVR